jgi:hypothetical protein
MRRNLIVILAAGFLLFGCSSSKKDSNASSGTSSSTVQIAAADAASCADLQAYAADLKTNAPKIGDGSGAAGAARIKAFFAAMLPSIQKAQQSASAVLRPSLDVIQSVYTQVGTLDPNSTADQQRLMATLLLSEPTTNAAVTSLIAYAKNTCGIVIVES